MGKSERLQALQEKAARAADHLAEAATALLNAQLEAYAHTQDSLIGMRCAATFANATAKHTAADIIHPTTGNRCTILVINDRGKGRFVLEDAITKKRSHTTTDIRSLLPLTLRPIFSQMEADIEPTVESDSPDLTLP